MQPTVGQIVNYTMNPGDCSTAAVQMGNPCSPGTVLPMIIVKVWPDGLCNGQVFLDGTGTLWVTSVREGEGQRTWAWPARV